MAFDLKGARAAGYGDAEIVDFLSSQYGFDVTQARADGYSDAEIADHLGSPTMQAKMPGIKAQQAARSDEYGRSEVARLGNRAAAATDARVSETLSAPVVDEPIGLAQAARPRRGGTRAEMAPSAPVQADVRRLDNRIEAERPKAGTLLTQPYTQAADQPFTEAEGVAGSVAPWKAIENARDRRPYQEAKPLSPAQELALDVRDVSRNPVYRGAAAGFSELGKVGVGAVRAGADLLGANGVADFASGASRAATQMGDAAGQGLGGNEKLVADITSSILNSAPSLAMGMAGGPALRTLFATSAANEYNAGRDAGFSGAESAARAGIMGMAEALGERFGFPQQIALLKGVVKGLPADQMAKVFGNMLMQEIPGEQLTTAMQFLADKIGPAALAPNATIDDYLKAAGETLKVTIGQTAVMGGGPAAINATRQAMRRADAATAAPEAQIASAIDAAQPPQPTEMRSAYVRQIDNFGAQHGIRPNVLKAIKDATAGVPLAELPQRTKAIVSKLAENGLIQAPTDPQSLAALDPLGAAATGLAEDIAPPASQPQAAQVESDSTQPPPATPETVAGAQINRNWSEFSPESGTLGVPRDQMPQVSNRGALVNFLNARGIPHTVGMVPAEALKPTQAEFSPQKVQGYDSTRSILVSQDGHILDGHHAWLAALQAGQPVNAIQFGAPIQDLLRLAHQMPSSTTSPGPRRTKETTQDVSGNVARGDGGSGLPDAGRGDRDPGLLDQRSSVAPDAAGPAAAPALGARPGDAGPGRRDDALTFDQVQPGDITRPNGQPFRTMQNALSALARAGGEATHELARVEGGLVVRPKAAQSGTEAAPQPAAAAPASPARVESDSTPAAADAQMDEVIKTATDGIQAGHELMARQGVKAAGDAPAIEADQQPAAEAPQDARAERAALMEQAGLTQAEMNALRGADVAEMMAAQPEKKDETRPAEPGAVEAERAEQDQGDGAGQPEAADGAGGDAARDPSAGEEGARKEGLRLVAHTTGKGNESAAAQPEPAKDSVEHAGLKLYKTKVRRDGKTEDRWAVQIPENKGTDKFLGDTLHATLEEAKKAAEDEVRRFERDRQNKAEIEAAEQKRQVEKAERKASNKGKSIAERRADAVLDKPVSSNGKETTRRRILQGAVDAGQKFELKMVFDPAAKKRDEEAINNVRRRGYILGASNENIPVVKAGLEALARLKGGKYEKPEYRMYLGQTFDGPFREITKTEFDYAQSLIAAQNQESAAAQPEPAKPEKAEAQPAEKPVAAEKKTAKIEDFGEKLQGARKDDAGNVAMLDLRVDDGAQMTALDGTRATADRIAREWANAPEIVVVRDMTDEAVPARARAQYRAMREKGAKGSPRGFYFGGKVYLVASVLGTPQRVAETLFHETLGHAGFRGAFGDALDKMLDQMVRLNRPAVEDKAKQYGLSMSDPAQAREAAEEALATLAQERPTSTWVEKAVAAIRSWLRKHVPFLADMEMSRDELVRTFIAPARGWIERGRGMAEGDEVRFQAAYHGTPYRGIERFDTSKIGTGEGAQAYGWGLYFAGKKEVAEWYRNSLTAPKINGVKLNGRKVDPGTPVYHAVRKVVEAGGRGTREEVIAHLRDRVQAYRSLPDHFQRQAADILGLREVEGALKKVEAAKSFAVDTPERNPGQLYKVEIPEDSEMLLWDKPLSEQPEKVREALAGMGGGTTLDQVLAGKSIPELLKWVDGFDRNNSFDEMVDENPDMTADDVREAIKASYDPDEMAEYIGSDSFSPDRTGESIYRELSTKQGGDRVASEALAALGIKGIKYLDGTSRGAGDGSYNYVIFSGDDVAVQRAFYQLDDANAQRAVTETPEFKRWFGDSKVVDANGKPLVVYHGTHSDFSAFDNLKTGTASDAGWYGDGFYFTPDPKEASEGYAFKSKDANVMPVYLSIKNPYDWRSENERGLTQNAKQASLEKRAELEKRGFDGVFVYEDTVQLGPNQKLTDAQKEMFAGNDRTTVDVFGWDFVENSLRRKEWSFQLIAQAYGYEFAKSLPKATRTLKEIVAFRPEQIKSAIGNNGQFDPTNPDIRFQLDDIAQRDALKADITSKVAPAIRDALSAHSAGKITWWDKSVGTPYNLAQRKPQFKRVFDALNAFINGTSTYANAAADMAPTWLPGLSGLKDLKKRPVAAADSEAVAKPIFEGTTVWIRDANGKPIKIDEARKTAEAMSTDDKAHALLKGGHLAPRVLKMWQGLEVDRYEQMIADKYDRDVMAPGVVFKDSELKDLFGLAPAQIKLYREFRAGVDKSLEDMTISAMLRVGGKDTADLRDQALDMPMNDAAELLRDRMYELAAAEADPKKKAEFDAAGNQMIDLADKVSALTRRGYAPLMRFGDRTLTVTAPDGEMLYFGMYETGMERYQARQKLKQAFPDATITMGTVSKEEFKMFAGISPETLELFGDIMGDKLGFDTSSPVYQEYLRRAKANGSGMKRLIKRKGTAGYREEPARVLASFIYSNARQTSRNLHSAAVTEAINDIDRTDGELKDYAIKLDEYVRNPQEEAQAIRGLMFVNFIGGSVASAMVNLTQPFQVTMPWLMRYDAAAPATMAKALKLMWQAKTGNDGLDAAVKAAEKEGILDPQEVYHLMAQARGSAQLQAGKGVAGQITAAAGNNLARLMVLWGAPFSLAEAFNRRLTFVAAVLVAQKKGIEDPVKFGEKAIAETQFIYTKVNNPRWARGPVGATLMTFKKFGVSWVEAFARMAAAGPDGKAAALVMLAMLILMTGIEGLPFREDLEDLIDGFANRVLDRNFQTKLWRRQLLREAVGEAWANFINAGISGLPGAPIDVSGRLGMHNMIPGTGALPKKKDYGNDAYEVLGATGGALKQYAEAAAAAAEGNASAAALKMAPVAIQNAAKGLDMYRTGAYRDTRGNVVMKTAPAEAAAKAVGFQPRSVAEFQGQSFLQQRRIALARQVEGEIVDQIASSKVLGKPELYDEAKKRLDEWNKKNPDSVIRIESSQIIARMKTMSTEKAQRVIKSAPQELRKSVQDALAR